MWMIRTPIAWIWASPTTIPAMLYGTLSMLFGTKVRRVSHTLEFHGGPVSWFLSRTPVRARAMTLGHVIFGQDECALDECREHEWVHVRQYERWGLLFVPTYLLCSAVLKLRGRNAYFENPFEAEAFEHDRLCSIGEMDRKAPIIERQMT